MRIVTLAGSPGLRSRSGVILAHGQRWLVEHGASVRHFGIHDFKAEDLLHARFDSPDVQVLIEAVAAADALVIATPVYKASFSGALKTLLDLLPERALCDKPVLPIASGGSLAHMLAVDYALKPVLSALKAQQVLHGIFAIDAQVSYDDQGGTLADDLRQRLGDGLQQLLEILQRRPARLQPHQLGDSLKAARWGI
ncbi:NADPH-dependent FMN reductase [Aquipseudomonas alcaligenes]